MALLLLRAALLGAPGCQPVAGEHLTAADLFWRVPAAAALPPDRALGPAPLAGAVRVMKPAELRRWL